MAVQPTTELYFDWICYACDAAAPIDSNFVCTTCGEPRSLHASAPVPRGLFEHAPTSMWHYAPLLPVMDASCAVSLGEGNTPLVFAPQLATRAGMQEVRLKLESSNPTGSFKDRQISVAVSHAKCIGAETVAVVSSGNVAAATAAYCARAGLQAVLFMHGQASPSKIAQAAAYGAKVLCVDSPSPAAVFQLCLEACAKFGWYHGSTAGMYEPYNVEGSKTIAYELWQQYSGNLPEFIVCPVGGGGLLGGIWRGLKDLERMKLIDTMPRLVAVQATGCAPLKQAMEENWSFSESLKHPWPNPKSIAGGIADDVLFDGHTALPAIRRTNGLVVTVDDDEIRQAMQRLAREEGLLADACAATAVAALTKIAERNIATRACCIISGSGLKELTVYEELAPTPTKVACDLAAVAGELAM